MKPRTEPVPAPRPETIRRQIIAFLEQGPAGARRISTALGIRERAVYQHLEHVRRSLHRQGQRLVMTPSVCHECGYVFRNRERLDRPGRCPRCRGTSLSEPLFEVKE